MSQVHVGASPTDAHYLRNAVISNLIDPILLRWNNGDLASRLHRALNMPGSYHVYFQTENRDGLGGRFSSVKIAHCSC